VAALFVADTEINTCTAPLFSVWQNAATPGTKSSEQMRQFVSKGPIDFAGVIAQSRIERDQSLMKIRATGAAFQSRIPFDANLVGDSMRSIRS